MSVADLMTWLMPDPQTCRQEAERLARAHPGRSPEQLARYVIGQARHWGAATGATTGAIANPIIMVPAAMADMAAVLRFEGQMAGTIAALLDPASLNDPAIFQGDVLSIVFPSALSQALRQIGVRFGQQITRNLIRKYLTAGVVEQASRFAAKRLFLHVGERAIVSKSVPLVGAGIGAGWNWMELHLVGSRALRYYLNRTVTTTAREPVSIRRVLKLLPWRKSDPTEPPPLPT